MIEGAGGLGEVEEIIRKFREHRVKIVGWFVHVATVFTWIIKAAKVKMQIVLKSSRRTWRVEEGRVLKLDDMHLKVPE